MVLDNNDFQSWKSRQINIDDEIVNDCDLLHFMTEVSTLNQWKNFQISEIFSIMYTQLDVFV